MSPPPPGRDCCSALAATRSKSLHRLSCASRRSSQPCEGCLVKASHSGKVVCPVEAKWVFRGAAEGGRNEFEPNDPPRGRKVRRKSKPEPQNGTIRYACYSTRQRQFFPRAPSR